MAERTGYRGYIGSRPCMGERCPQHVQNLVIRDYCQRNGLVYLLSATEYAMKNCYVMLEEVMRELPRIEGVVMYSLFMLPERRAARTQVFKRVLGAKCTLHGALENLTVASDDDARRIEDILRINHCLGAVAPAGLAGSNAGM